MMLIEQKIVQMNIIQNLYFTNDSDNNGNNIDGIVKKVITSNKDIQSNMSNNKNFISEKSNIKNFSNEPINLRIQSNSNKKQENTENKKIMQTNEIREIDKSMSNNSNINLFENRKHLMNNNFNSNNMNMNSVNDVNNLLNLSYNSYKDIEKQSVSSSIHKIQRGEDCYNNSLENEKMKNSTNNKNSDYKEMNEFELNENNNKNIYQIAKNDGREAKDFNNCKDKKFDLKELLNEIRSIYYKDENSTTNFSTDILFNNVCNDICSLHVKSKLSPVNIKSSLIQKIIDGFNLINPFNSPSTEEIRDKKFEEFIFNIISSESDMVNILQKSVQHDYLMNDYYFRLNHKDFYEEYLEKLKLNHKTFNESLKKRIFIQ